METQANNFRIKILPKVKVCVEIPKLQNYLLGTPTSPHSDPKVLRQLKGNKFLGILFFAGPGVESHCFRASKLENNWVI